MRYLAMAVVLTAGIGAAIGAEKEPRRHGTHQHGVGKLNLVLEGKMVSIELESPADNIVGFEHAPRTATQKTAMQDALAILKNADKVFGLTPEAQCRGQANHVQTEAASPESKNQGDSHSEFHMQYRFTCEKPDRLKTVDVHLFKLFPNTRTLDVQVAAPNGQNSVRLKRGLMRITLP